MNVFYDDYLKPLENQHLETDWHLFQLQLFYLIGSELAGKTNKRPIGIIICTNKPQLKKLSTFSSATSNLELIVRIAELNNEKQLDQSFVSDFEEDESNSSQRLYKHLSTRCDRRAFKSYFHDNEGRMHQHKICEKTKGYLNIKLQKETNTVITEFMIPAAARLPTKNQMKFARKLECFRKKSNSFNSMKVGTHKKNSGLLLDLKSNDSPNNVRFLIGNVSPVSQQYMISPKNYMLNKSISELWKLSL